MILIRSLISIPTTLFLFILSCFKPPSLWHTITADMGNKHTYPGQLLPPCLLQIRTLHLANCPEDEDHKSAYGASSSDSFNSSHCCQDITWTSLVFCSGPAFLATFRASSHPSDLKSSYSNWVNQFSACLSPYAISFAWSSTVQQKYN